MFFMKSLTIEQYGAGIGDDFDAIIQLEYMKYQMIVMNLGTFNSTVQVFLMTFELIQTY